MTPGHPYAALRAHCQLAGLDSPWEERLCGVAADRWSQCNHGDLPRWLAALEQLRETGIETRLAFDTESGRPRFGRPVSDPDRVAAALMALHPWRKGPLDIAGVEIDTEWRSDWKWARIAPHVALEGSRVLDVGCGNGYYGWRMLEAGARLVIGIDPTWVYVMQWLACRRFSGDLPNFVLPMGIEHLPDGSAAFDTVFSMGVLYHRRNASAHLQRLYVLLRPGGTLVLESLVLPDEQAAEVLRPGACYARMRNVWAVPGCDRLLQWMTDAQFGEVEIVDVGW
ncbi:MAG: tRNA 5-methoxyuridine(34)/uridine 5-oxyacetic acid(34) synthase CmoB, partial [Xanthomonadales bacterium]|nr:tRNA 5-methoxyuridine(34)/uridine 5-oxyacetic acid(34) synthase CmoB [Xanthomonadales bacterium]